MTNTLVITTTKLDKKVTNPASVFPFVNSFRTALPDHFDSHQPTTNMSTAKSKFVPESTNHCLAATKLNPKISSNFSANDNVLADKTNGKLIIIMGI